jgi:hypothetical protein
VPGVVLPKNFGDVPVVTKEPTVLVVLAARFRVPPVKVSALAVTGPNVKASRQLVVPLLLKVTGKSIALPLLVIVCVPVLSNVVTNAPLVSVMPDARVRSP